MQIFCRSDRVIFGSLFLVVIVVTFYSSNLQRVGPELGVWGNVCGESGNELCYKPALNGGFPFPYFFEDDIRWIIFMIDVILNGVFLSAVFLIGKEVLR